MPIYAYKCSSCGHTDDVLQKLSAAPLTVCPACSQAAYSKQVTAPQFQLKGSGWYVTDFKGGASGGKEGKTDAKSEPANADATPAAADTKNEPKTDSGAAGPVQKVPSGAPAATPAATPAPAPAKPVAANE